LGLKAKKREKGISASPIAKSLKPKKIIYSTEGTRKEIRRANEMIGKNFLF
jgi:hypothetical protein